jgi:subtilisin family serine protease
MFKKVLFSSLIIFSFITISFSQDVNYVQGEMIIWLKADVNPNSVISRNKYLDLRAKEHLVPDMNIWLFEFDYNRMSPELAIQQVRRDVDVFVAQFNHYISQRLTPNDPSFSQQWALNNTGQSGGTPDADIDAPEAWNITTNGLTALGDSIVVCVVDGGFYLTHQDLKFWKNWREIPGNNIDDDTNGYIDDVNGWNAVNQNGNIGTDAHGTHVSGIAGAIGNNSIGISGVNWGIKIMAIQGSSSNEAVVVRAYGYCLKQRKLYNQTNGVKGAFVVSTNSSFGVDYGQPVNFPLWCAFYDSLGNAGILSACATANLNINIDVQGDIPTACPSPYMVSVTNTTNTDAKNSGAAYGLLTIDLGAPGTSVYSTTSAPSTYANMTGTSMATPHVAGAVAFMYAAASPWFIQQYKLNPGAYALIVKDKILQGVDPKPSLQNITVSGGRLNIYNSALLIQTLTGNGNITGISPMSYRLYDNYPNPFNPSTIIRYDVPKEGYVTLKIYDALGREVAALVNKDMKPGSYESVWNATNFTSGVYFYKLVSGNFTDTRRMALIK